MKIYDAHVHFNLRAEDPILDFEKHFENNGVIGSTLIVNTEEELTLFEKNRKRLMDSVGSLMTVAGIFDLRTSSSCSRYEKWREWGFRTCLKIHPRKSGLTRIDILPLADRLCERPEKTVIVDCFGYGHCIENHIGMELGIRLAERFPEKNIVLAHSGGHKVLECMLYTRTLKNIYYDLSLSCCYLYGTSAWNDLVHLVHFNSGRTVFGSDYPDFSQEMAIMKCLELCEKAQLDEQKMKHIFQDNAEKIYGSFS